MTEMTGHDAEIAGHVEPKYADGQTLDAVKRQAIEGESPKAS